MDQERQALLTEFARGAELIFDNAEHLYREACILRGHGALSRAYCLHQLSNEECGKLELLGNFAMTICCGLDYDLKEIAKALRDHQAKNHANAWDAGPSPGELDAAARGDFAAYLSAFGKLKKEIHGHFNTNKNAALYVNFEKGFFSAPQDVITNELVQEIAILNDYFIRIRKPYVRLFRRVATNEWGFQRLATRLLERLVEEEQPTSRFEVERMKTLAREVVAESLAESAHEAGAAGGEETAQPPGATADTSEHAPKDLP